jgi:N-acetylglucosamine-6-phosphate deacetylase
MAINYLTASYIFDGKQLLTNHSLVVDNEVVVAIKPNSHIPQQAHDLGNVVITRGFIDLQLNGCGGVLFNDDISEQTLETMYQTCLKYATTSFLPTLITTDMNSVATAFEVVDKWINRYGNTRGVLGLHLEGPFISREKPGIHDTNYIHKPQDSELKQIAAYAKKYPLKMTIAPEVFSLQQIQFLNQSGVILSIGHSNASYEIAKAGFENGIKTATHVFNAMSGLSGRNPGVVGAIMNSDCYVGLIADLIHVSPANIELLYKLKNQRLYIVTDAVTPMGTNLTEFKLAGKKMLVQDGKCVDEQGTIGGANITMNQSLKNLVVGCNIPLEDALKMALTVPAGLLNQLQLGNIINTPVANLFTIDLADYSPQNVRQCLV